jgi:hypothetical protein
MQAASLAIGHCDRSATLAIAPPSAADAMFARTNARHSSSSKERWRRLFLPSAAHLADIGPTPLARTPIERRKLSFAHGSVLTRLATLQERQLMLVLSALLAYVIDCRFDMGLRLTNTDESKAVKT